MSSHCSRSSWSAGEKHQKPFEWEIAGCLIQWLCIVPTRYRLQFMHYGRIRLRFEAIGNVPHSSGCGAVFNVFAQKRFHAVSVLENDVERTLEWTGSIPQNVLHFQAKLI